MVEGSDRFVVITGGPGSGKTTLIEALAGQGFARSVEAGRAIIRDQLEIGGTALPWRDATAFAELMLSWEMRSHAIASAERGAVVFDRGVPDVLGYLRLTGLEVPPHATKAAERFRYNRTVFIAPHWPEIFRQDAERRQNVDEAVRTYDAMTEVYAECGYELVVLPLSSVAGRVRFVMTHPALATSL